MKTNSLLGLLIILTCVGCKHEPTGTATGFAGLHGWYLGAIVHTENNNIFVIASQNGEAVSIPGNRTPKSSIVHSGGEYLTLYCTDTKAYVSDGNSYNITNFKNSVCVLCSNGDIHVSVMSPENFLSIFDSNRSYQEQQRAYQTAEEFLNSLPSEAEWKF